MKMDQLFSKLPISTLLFQPQTPPSSYGRHPVEILERANSESVWGQFSVAFWPFLTETDQKPNKN